MDKLVEESNKVLDNDNDMKLDLHLDDEKDTTDKICQTDRNSIEEELPTKSESSHQTVQLSRNIETEI